MVSYTLRNLAPGKTASCNHWIGRCVGFGLDMERRDQSLSARKGIPQAVQPAARHF